MHGWDRLRPIYQVSDDVRPTPADLVTYDQKDLTEQLKKVARAMTDEQRLMVARSDYGDNVEKHLNALNAILASPDLLFPEDDRWYPQEPVELITYEPGHIAFVECTALALINAFPPDRGLVANGICSNWVRNYDAYGALPAPIRDLFSKSYRHLYETGEHFEPYMPKKPKKPPSPRELLTWLPE